MQIAHHRILSREEERTLIRRYRRGDKVALATLIACNQGLILKIARRVNASFGFHMSMDDLIQEGNLGLITAIKKFDLKKKCKISTYATFWIQTTIRRAIQDTARTVRVPNRLQDLYVSAILKGQNYFRKYGHLPTEEKVLKWIGIKRLKNLDIILGSIANVNLDAPDVKPIAQISLQEVEDTIDKELILKYINEHKDLNELEKKIVIMRLGLYDQHAVSFDEIGKEFDVSLGKAMGIYESGIKKIRKNWKNSRFKKAI